MGVGVAGSGFMGVGEGDGFGAIVIRM